MDRIFKPSWFRAAQDSPLSIGKENRATTRLLRLPKVGGGAEAAEPGSGLNFEDFKDNRPAAALAELD